MKYAALLLILVCGPTWGQKTTTGKSQTTGPCSPSITGNNNTVVIVDGSCEARQKEVTIHPSRAVFHPASTAPDGFSQTSRFRAQNNTDDDIYSVVFKLKSSGLKLSDFKVGVPKSSQIALSDDPALKRMGDVAGIYCTDLKEHPVWIGIISHLGPHDSREITLTLLNPAAELVPPSGVLPPHVALPQPGRGVTVEAKIVEFSRDSSILEKPGTQGQYFRLDETLKCGAVFATILE